MSEALFDGHGPRVRTVAASAPFLDTLVDAVLASLPRDDPFALADTIIFLPNRRASTGLVEAFAKKLGGAALLPAIRALGDLDDDPDVWGPEPLALEVPPEIMPLRRRFELAELVRRRDIAQGGVADPVRALAWADELCRLLDGAATVGAVDWSQLATLVQERDLAEHWERSAQFLEIVASYWPQRLAADGLCDPAERRAILLTRLAQAWAENPPQKPVIIAGSTGSVAATRTLMRVVASLPQGCVILPGLDLDLDEDAWRQVDAQHPQQGLRLTLEALDMARADVRPLAATETARARARRLLLNEALAPAQATADWRDRLHRLGGAELVQQGLQGLSILDARNEEEEALVIALLLREAAETPARTAALVTPDAALARRVMQKLARWDIVPQTSVGPALAESPHGTLLLLLAELLVDDGPAVPLLALLRHPLVTLGMNAPARAAAIDALERQALRKPRTWADLAALSDKMSASAAGPLTRALSDALAPIVALRHADLTLAQLADAMAESAERLAPYEEGAPLLWSGPEGEAAAGVLRDMAECGGHLGALAARDAPRALSLLLAARQAPPPRGGHPRIAILGPLEARLQQRDLLVLGGLVEGGWPAPPPEDAFLSRAMRRDLGLPDPDARIGLAAHDFAQLACAPEVVLTWPAMREGAPAVPSRWIWRLKTLARASGDDAVLTPARDPRPLARALDAPGAIVRLRPPQPKPPVAARPPKISFSKVETLIRDPYAIYARQVLQLDALDPPGVEAGPRDRGNAVHTALEKYDGEGAEALLAQIEANLAAAGFDPVRCRMERARFAGVAAAFVAWHEARAAAGYESYFEKDGQLDLGGRSLYGRADRFDIRHGRAAVIDYKTGSAATNKQVDSGLSPQLTLEAAVLARGGFPGVPVATAEEIIYWRFSGGQDRGPHVVKFDEGSAADAAEEALLRLKDLLKKYDSETQAYLCKPKVQFINDWDDYDHFARRAEWGDAGDGDNE
jgi:ATP-dependent helicase/nuclease subunit B